MNISFGALYTNPNGSTVNVSEAGINQAKVTAHVRHCVDEAFEKNPEYYYKYKDSKDSVKFIIDCCGNCVLIPNDFKAGHIMYHGKTEFGLKQGTVKPHSIHAYRYGTKNDYSDECGSIRSYGCGGYKFAHIQPDYSVNITYPEWAPKE